jgi:hypothetical protein
MGGAKRRQPGAPDLLQRHFIDIPEHLSSEEILLARDHVPVALHDHP